MKHIVLSLFLLLFGTASIAQSTQPIRFYIRAGAGGSRAIGEDTSEDATISMPGNTPYQVGGTNWLSTGMIGAGVIVPLDDHFIIQAELNVEQKGSKNQVGKADNNLPCDFYCPAYQRVFGQVSSRLTYLTLPVMLGYRLGKITVLAGPYVGYKLGEKIQGTYTYAQSSASELPIVSSTERYKRFDAGFIAAAAYAVSPRFGIDLRYSQGLRYVATPYVVNNFGNTTSEPIYNQSAQVGVTYALTRNEP